MRLRDHLVRAAASVPDPTEPSAVVDAVLDELISRVPSAEWSDDAEDWLRDVKNGQRW